MGSSKKPAKRSERLQVMLDDEELTLVCPPRSGPPIGLDLPRF